MSESRRVKAGVVGCGDIALHGYFPHVSEIFDLVATCDIIEDRAKEMARIWGAKEAYSNIDDMLAQSDIEAAFILTSMSTHAELALKAAQAGKHILVQKPFATDFDEGLAVVDAVRNAGVKAVVEPNYWLDPVYKKAKEIIDEGHIGTVHYIVGRSERDFVPLWGGDNFYEYEGGGMLFDMGVYIISGLVYLMGPATKVTGSALVSVPERPAKFPESVFTEYLKTYVMGDDPHRHEPEWEDQRTVPAVMEAPDNTFTMIEWPNDCLGCVVANSVSFVLPPAGPRMFLCGEKGTIAFGVPGAQSRLSVATVDRDSPYHVSERRGGGVGWYHFPGNYFPQYGYMRGTTQHLHDCIVNDTEPVGSVEWGMHIAEIMIKCFQSAEEGRALDLETTF